MLQNATPLKKSAPWPPNISDEHVSCTAPATENASSQILLKCPMPATVFENATRPSRFAHFWQPAQPLAFPHSPHKRASERPKCSETLSFFCIFNFEMCFAPQRRALFPNLNVQKWSEHVFLTCLLWNVLRATTARTFSDISTSKSGPDLVCFVRFDFDVCFAPQRCALFRHLNLQKWSEREVALAFSVANVLRATTACNFSSLIWPAGSAPAASASLLFDPREPQIIGTTQCFATFLPFRAPGSSFFWDFIFFFSSLLWLFPSLLFICPYCRKFDF